ncbi:hypothetical protein COOONC_07105 [Cooperia oncophora]
MALLCLEAVVDSSEGSSDSLSIVLPGISSTLANIACNSSSGHFQIPVLSLKIMSRAVCFCMADSMQCSEYTPIKELEPAIQELYVQRDESWRASTAANITKIVRVLCATLALHRDEDVRMTLLESVYSIRCECRKSFKNSLDNFLLDLFLTIQTPSSPCRLVELISKVRDEDTSAFSLHMHEKLRELSERIPLNIQKKMTGIDVLFRQV